MPEDTTLLLRPVRAGLLILATEKSPGAYEMFESSLSHALGTHRMP